MRNNKLIGILAAALISVWLAGCAAESSQTISVPVPPIAAGSNALQHMPIAVGKFDNRSSFMRGIFSDGADRLGSQSKTILIAKLQATNRFNVLDRDNLPALKQEAEFKKQDQNIKGADFVIIGDVTEFGSQDVGDRELFGVLGRGKTQVAYAKVTLNVVNIATSEVVFTSQGAGEYTLSNREVLGFGGTAGYDSTLNGKVLDLAIRNAVDRLVANMDAGPMRKL